ncbi:N5-glutamine methyltransferase family protein [Hugonella massiliensis]|uniref:N5-glutamine methyltransferase family protein n=1 Tax=Hugonella massiliensis TaxID=1720315 RepID=UPI000A945A7E|nr:HemK/PrmC family methyltransferase [Hugonella massiliensis]
MAQPWTVGRILSWMEGFLGEHGDENPRLSAQWLVSDALGVSRIQLYADLARPLTLEERDVLRAYTKRRAAGEPLQYITGTTDFRFITVDVRPGVLIPRPETEVLVSEALAEVRAVDRARKAAAVPALEGSAEAGAGDGDAAGRSADATDADGKAAQGSAAPACDPFLAVDACTGSGCIACSLAHEIPDAQVCATDISAEAVGLARHNAEKVGVADRVTVAEGDLLDPVGAPWRGAARLVISNPPYVPTSVVDGLPREVRAHEPRLALDGGVDGLDLYRRLLGQAAEVLAPEGVLAVELHETCLDEAARLASAAGFEGVRIACDLAGRPRVLIARMPAADPDHPMISETGE